MRIVIADAHPEVRSALRLLLETLDRSWSVVAEVADYGSLQTCARLHDADLVLLEWDLPGMARSAHGQHIRAIRGSGRSLIVALGPANEDCALAWDAGVDAVIRKNDLPERVITVLRRVGRQL